ncbi:YopX family protein [Streptococcus suis]|nr:YopX family protein [Streptococcus suis]
MIPKFRAWTEEGEVMYYDVYPFKDETLLLSYDEIAFDEVPASDFILMQSTGFLDGNGTEVFEGDLIQLFNGDVGKVSYNKILAFWEVQFNNGELNLNDIIYFGGEVIGNIYEDKHLLEE